MIKKIQMVYALSGQSPQVAGLDNMHCHCVLCCKIKKWKWKRKKKNEVTILFLFLVSCNKLFCMLLFASFDQVKCSSNDGNGNHGFVVAMWMFLLNVAPTSPLFLSLHELNSQLVILPRSVFWKISGCHFNRNRHKKRVKWKIC